METPTRADPARIDRKLTVQDADNGDAATSTDFEAVDVRSDISRPDRGPRNWTKNPAARRVG
jgi:hypothetical protein